MSATIDFAIDLGTTNSLVARCDKGVVEVFKNPVGFKETLPSVVGFRNDRILVGDPARAYLEREPENVVGSFKRKMGTTESFRIQSLGQSKTPTDLSAFVLKELKGFIHTGETPEAVVITIPASFDMVQSNATKVAGHAAGFKQVVLLQEPIAASLAYANKAKNAGLRNSQWIVYDLGGGTFDVALVRIVGGELKIVDHEGDNYLGGSDFDAMLVERIVVPQLEKRGEFTNLLAQMKSREGRFSALWHGLLLRAEEAKIELTTRTSAEIDLGRMGIVDEKGKVIDDYIQITRSELEALIKDAVDKTAAMLKKILTRNSLRPKDIEFTLMVGGSTYIPFVRRRIEELLGIPINTGIDPTNAIAVGAAYFAATKEIDLGETSAEAANQAGALRIKVSYNRASQDLEELFAAKVDGDVEGLFYRITRADGGFDSGLKRLAVRIAEDLPLQENAYNVFFLQIHDSRNNPVATNVDSIQIAQGKYSVAGQMLPADLSLVVDDDNTGDCRLVQIFGKNCVLPAKKKMTREVTRTIAHGSDDEVIRIIVVEGPSENHFTANKKQGVLLITGKQLQRDLLRGSEIDLTFKLSESRDLHVTAYINPSGPEFSDIFSPKYRDVDTDELAQEVEMLQSRLNQEIEEAVAHEKYEVAKEIERLRGTARDLHGEVVLMALDDVTDDKFKLDDRKRSVSEELCRLTSGKRIERLRVEYQNVKDDVMGIVSESGNDLERRQLHELVTRENVLLNTTNPQKLETAIDELRGIALQILRRKPDFLLGVFQHLIERREVFNDQPQAKNLIEAGKRHIAAEDYDHLDEVIGRLYSLLPQEEQGTDALRYYTGIR